MYSSPAQSLPGGSTAVLVLAAGKGTRMHAVNEGYPKVLTTIQGRPMIMYLLDSITRAGLASDTKIVVGYGAELVRQVVGPDYVYIEQHKQLGTAHAVASAEQVLSGRTDHVMVLYADHPMIKPTTIFHLHNVHTRGNSVVTLLTTTVRDFRGWRSPFYDAGRIIRDNTGKILGIRERKDATDQELTIGEVNTGMMAFRADWLWRHIRRVHNHNAKREYYLTDLVKVAIDEQELVTTIHVNPLECSGVNTPDHLVLVNLLIHSDEARS